MATLTVRNPRVVSGHLATTRMLILNGQSWKKGELLNVDASGLLNECASDDYATSTGGIKFLALNDQANPGNSTTTVEVGVLTRDIVLEGNELDGTVSNANVGQQYGIDVTSNVLTIDTAETTAAAIEVVDVASNYAPENNSTSDVSGRLKFKILTTSLEAAPA